MWRGAELLATTCPGGAGTSVGDAVGRAAADVRGAVAALLGRACAAGFGPPQATVSSTTAHATIALVIEQPFHHRPGAPRGAPLIVHKLAAFAPPVAEHPSDGGKLAWRGGKRVRPPSPLPHDPLPDTGGHPPRRAEELRIRCRYQFRINGR